MPTSTASHPAPPHAGTIGRLADRARSRDDKVVIGRPHGVDPTMVQIAVELTMPKVHTSARLVEPYLQALQNALLVDSVFVALFDRTLTRVSWIAASNSNYQYCNPYELIGISQPFNVELLQRLKMQQLLDVRDGTYHAGEYAELSKQLMPLNLCSMLIGGITAAERVVGFMLFGSLHRRNDWDTETHLTMKLMTACYTAGLERSQLRSK